MSSQPPRPTPQLTEVAKDIFTSLLLLLGALVIEEVKHLFGRSGPPTIVRIIVNVSEVTLLLSFAIHFVQAAAVLLRELDQLWMILRKSNVAQDAKSLIKIAFPTRANFIHAIRNGALAGGLIAALIAMSLVSSMLSRAFLTGLIAIIVLGLSLQARIRTSRELLFELSLISPLFIGLAIQKSGGTEVMINQLHQLAVRW